MEDWRYELRIRCVPQDLHDLYERDKATFVFYYDQVLDNENIVQFQWDVIYFVYFFTRPDTVRLLK